MSSKELRARLSAIEDEYAEIGTYLKKGKAEADRVVKVANAAPRIVEKLDCEFEKKTGLNKTDVTFLFVAVALQVLRQYLLSNEKCRMSPKENEKLTKKVVKKVVPKSWQECLSIKVPYDAVNSLVPDADINPKTHRYKTLGHDPVFGLFFGTLNIATDSLTNYRFSTYSVSDGVVVSPYAGGTSKMIGDGVAAMKVDVRILIASLARQLMHMSSDMFTSQGLPVPGVCSMDVDLAQKMVNQWKIDTYSIARSAGLAELINFLISVTHTFFYKGKTERAKKLYEVKTRKIIMYSNTIASASNVLYVAVTKDMKKLDVGGLLVTLHHLISDSAKISEIKAEFLTDSFAELIEGNGDYLYKPE